MKPSIDIAREILDDPKNFVRDPVAGVFPMHFNALYDIIAAAIDAARAEAWQPVETAPFDQDVLVYIAGAAQGMEYEIAHRHADAPEDWYAATVDGFPFDMPVTHWRPLLPPKPRALAQTREPA